MSVSVVCGVIEPGPKTKALRIVILFGGGRCWSKEHQKNSRKFKICIYVVEDLVSEKGPSWTFSC